MTKLVRFTDDRLLEKLQNHNLSQTVEVNAVDPQFNNMIIAMIVILFMVWLAILNIGLQKIGVSIPKVAGKFFKDVKRLIVTKK